jgi:hypothetical protein
MHQQRLSGCADSECTLGYDDWLIYCLCVLLFRHLEAWV